MKNYNAIYIYIRTLHTLLWHAVLLFNNIKNILFNIKVSKNNCFKKIAILINKLKLCQDIIKIRNYIYVQT